MPVASAKRVPVLVISSDAAQRALARAWRAEAACMGMTPNQFFPGRGRSSSEAKAVCHTCSVVEPCLTYAFVVPDTQGVWGGTTEHERQRLRSRVVVERARCASCGAEIEPPRTLFCSDACARISQATRHSSAPDEQVA